MRYLREIQNEAGRAAIAYDDRMMEIDVTPRTVTLTSRQGNLLVRAQFTREEIAQLIAIVQHEDHCTRQLQRFEAAKPGWTSVFRAIARPFL